MGKELEEQEEDILILFFSSGPSFKQFRDYEPRLNRLFPRNSLPKIRDEAYVKNFDDKKSKGTCSVSLFIDKKTEVYFDSFRIEYSLQEVSN